MGRLGTPTLWFFLCCVSLSFATPGWKVRETPEGTELITPYGTKELVGELAPKGTSNYRIEIPLSELKPSPTPASESSKDGSSDEWEEWVEEEIAESGDEEKDDAPKREVASVPPKIVVEYDDSDRYVLEANKLYNRGKFYDATQVVEELLRKKPTHVRGWIMKGSLMRVQGHKDLAKSAYEQALKLEPENGEIKKLVESYKR